MPARDRPVGDVDVPPERPAMLVIAHRGASGAAPENSVEAFRLADSMGADGIELDVRMARDGRLFVHHDPLPPELVLQDLVSGPALLGEALQACGDLLVNVEIKNSPDESDHDPTCALVEATIAEMRRHGPSDRWIVSSFDWATIERCRAVAPDIRTAFLTVRADADVVERTASGGHAALHPHHSQVTEDLVRRCHDAGIAVNTWTCNDPERLVQLAALGTDGVCTDVPDVALDALGRGGDGRPGPVRAWGTRA